LISNELLDILVDELTDDALVVGVLGNNSGEVAEALLVVGVDQGVSAQKRCLGASLHACGDNLLGNGLNWSKWLLNLIVLPVLNGSSSIVVVALESTLGILSGSSLLLLVVSSIVEVIVVLRSIVVVVAVVLERHATVELLLNEVENLLNQLNSVRSLEKSGVNLVRCDLLSLIVEISSILSLSLLLSADLGELVVSNIELLSIECRSVEVGTSVGRAIGLLEADEGAGGGLPVVAGEDLDALDLTEADKVLLQLLLR
jgi:hypothetical protein